uniref:Reverse transcriptase domain-containing protein n=1 Tax=Megaselia scalaris TaxID=36166 RepID=T1GNH9_MEGSC
MRTVEIETKNMITNKFTQIRGYVDDIEVVGRTTSSVAPVFQRLEKEARSRGLKENADKTNCMLSSRKAWMGKANTHPLTKVIIHHWRL